MTVFRVWIHAAANTYSTSGSMIKCPIVFRSPHSAAAGVDALEIFLSGTAWFPAWRFFLERWGCKRSAAMREPNPVVFLALTKLFLLILILQSVRPRVEREGKDVASVSHTRPVDFVMKAVERLVKEGYFDWGDQCEVHQGFCCWIDHQICQEDEPPCFC